MSFLRIENLSKAYPGVQALHNVSFQVEQGHTHALVGENGAGKSTLIKILAGAEQPDHGSIWLNEDPYHPHNPREALQANVSTIYQIFNLLPDRSITHNVMLGKEIRTRRGFMNLDAIRAETTRVLTTLGAAYLNPDTTIDMLKVGERQLVEIAKALINQSTLMIMDEPTSALNQNEVEALFRVIQLLKEQGVTVLYVSHRLDEIFQLADAVTVLRDGEHISTNPIRVVTHDSLIEDMIGRKLSSVFPPKARTSGTEVLRAENLAVRGSLHNVSFCLESGEILAIAGLSGSGKTELGKALFGDLPLQSGKIYLHGSAYSPSPMNAIRQGMIYLPEDRKVDGVLQELSIRRNISLSILDRIASPYGFLNLAEERAVSDQQIRALDIKTPHMDQLVLNLSGGNQQKVALAKCLAVQPEILILMEPTQGIDVGVKFEIYQFIKDQAANGRAILLISSELSEILGLAHRIHIMRDGTIAADLDADQTNQEEILRYALGTA